MNKYQKEHLLKIIDTYERRLRLLEQRAAKYGTHCPPEITIEIEDLKEEIQKLGMAVLALMDKPEGDIYDSLIDVEDRLKGVDSSLREVKVKEKKTFHIFGLPMFSVVVERVIMFVLYLFAVGSIVGLAGIVVTQGQWISSTPTILVTPLITPVTPTPNQVNIPVPAENTVTPTPTTTTNSSFTPPVNPLGISPISIPTSIIRQITINPALRPTAQRITPFMIPTIGKLIFPTETSQRR